MQTVKHYKKLYKKVLDQGELMSDVDKYKLLVRIKEQSTEYENIIFDLNRFNINTKEI